jgi:hypothetical protein
MPGLAGWGGGCRAQRGGQGVRWQGRGGLPLGNGGVHCSGAHSRVALHRRVKWGPQLCLHRLGVANIRESGEVQQAFRAAESLNLRLSSSEG